MMQAPTIVTMSLSSMMPNLTLVIWSWRDGKACKFLCTSFHWNILILFELITCTTNRRHGIRNLLESHEEVRKVYKESVGQIVQIARLSPKHSSLDHNTQKPKSIVVANTHLFYHPMAGELFWLSYVSRLYQLLC